VLGLVGPEAWIPKDLVLVSPVTKPVDLRAASAAIETLDPAEAEVRRNELLEAYLKHRKQDSFDLLGLGEKADAVTIEKKYLGFCQKFAPWRFESVQLADLIEKAEDLFRAAGRAFGELSDGEKRNALLIRRQTLRRQESAKPVADRFAIKSDLLDSEHQFKKGQTLMQKGNYREALQSLQFAHDCDPQNPVYRAELAYCDFLLAPHTQADKALDALQQTQRIDPKCGLAVYYAGLIHGDLGHRQDAESHLRHAIKLMMPDRRPIEALKELTSKKTRRQ
jgi:tetratricopeptide (TPR) repeat protein